MKHKITTCISSYNNLNYLNYIQTKIEEKTSGCI